MASRVARQGRRSFAYPVLLVIGVLDAAGYSLIAPILPQIADRTDVGPAVLGVLVAVFSVGIGLGFLVGARFVSHGRPETAIPVALLAIAAGSVGFGFAGDSLALYFLTRVVMGLGSGVLWMGTIFTVLERWPGREYVCISRLFGAYAIGGLVGPAIGAIGGVRAPLLTYAALLVAAAVAAEMIGAPAERRSFRPDRSVLRRRGFWLASAAILFAIMALGLAEAVLPLHFAERLGQAAIGLLFVGIGVMDATGTVVAPRFSPRPLLIAAMAAMTLGLSAAGWSDTVAVWLLALAVYGFGVGSGSTAAVGLLLEAVDPEEIVTGMIVWSQLGILGYLVGPIAGGAVAEWVGFGAIGLVMVAAAAAVLVVMRMTPGRAVG